MKFLSQVAATLVGVLLDGFGGLGGRGLGVVFGWKWLGVGGVLRGREGGE